MRNWGKLFFLMITFTAFLFSACTDDDDDDDTGDPRDKFVGSWNVEELRDIDDDPIYYDAQVKKSTSNSAYIEIYYIYFQDPNQAVDALVTGDNLTIETQTICNYDIQGGGESKSYDKFVLDYTVEDAADRINVTAKYTRN
jgi:hypothetical protein